jgi:hypothetical protein
MATYLIYGEKSKRYADVLNAATSAECLSAVIAGRLNSQTTGADNGKLF